MPAMRSARTVRSITLFGTLFLTAAFTVPAFAQIETVIVTAERRAVNIQTVPVAVTAFTSKDRDRIGITSIQDMANFTPGMTYSTSTDRVTLRGISRQTNVLSADSGVANYSDGIYQSFAVEAGRSSLGVDRVEVLRGPQGTLYGRNSIGGAINIISKRPTDTFDAEFRASYENYDHSVLEGTVSGPLGDDWGYRLYGDWDRQGRGYTKNALGPDEGNVIDTWYIEGQLQGKIGNKLDIWSRVYSTAWNNGAGGPGSASGGWTPADYPTYEVGQGGQLINSGYGCTVFPAQPLTRASNPTYPNAGADTTVASATAPAGLTNPCQNPAVHDPWHIARLVPYTDEVPGAYFGTVQATYHTDADFDIKFITGAEWYRYQLTGPAESGTDGTYIAPITSIKINAEGPLGMCFLGANFNTGLLNVTPYNNCTPGNVAGVDNVTVHPQASFNYQQQEFFTQNELNFQSTGQGPLDWQAGVYTFYQHESQPVSASAVGQFQLDNPVTLSKMAPFLPIPFQNAPPEGPFFLPHDPLKERWYDDRPAFDDRSLAVYGQAGYKFTDQFKATLGVRYSNDRKSGSEQSRLNTFGILTGLNAPENLGVDTPGFDITPPQVGTSCATTAPGVAGCTDGNPAGIVDYFDTNHTDIGVLGPACYNGPQAPAAKQCAAGSPAAPGFAFRRYAHTSDAFTGVFNLEWTPDDSSLAYAKYSRGYKGGGFNTGIFSYINPKPWVGPEHVNSYEIGAKKTFGEGWLVLDVAAYYYDYSSMQVPITIPAPPGGVAAPEFLNIPHATNRGFEAEAFFAPIEHLNAIVSYSFNDSHITSSRVQQYNEVTGTTFLQGVVDPADPTASLPGAKPLYTYAQCETLTPSPCGVDLYTLAPDGVGCSVPTTFNALGATPGTTGWGCVRPQSVKNQRLPNSPRNKIALNVSYDFVIPEFGTLTPSVTYRWVDSQYGTIFSRFYNMAPSWDQYDARVGFSSPDGHWTFYVYGHNIGSKLGYAQGALGQRLAGSINTGLSSSPILPTGAPDPKYCNGVAAIVAGPVAGPSTCYFVQGETAGALTPVPAGYGAVRGESAFGTVSNFNVNPPAIYGAQLQFKF